MLFLSYGHVLSACEWCVGTGKTHVAQLLSALETKRSGAPARIVSLDDYCMEERDEVNHFYIVFEGFSMISETGRPAV